MLANDQEKRCIEIANKIKRPYIETKIDEVQPPLLITPFFFIKKADMSFEGIFRKKYPAAILLFIMVMLFYLLLFVPLSILSICVRIVDRKNIQLSVQNILEKTNVNYEVSVNKQFSKLWSDKGLCDYGTVGIAFNDADKFNCLSKWIKILYNNDYDLKTLEITLNKRTQEELKEFYDKNPIGFHIKPVRAIDKIPKEIDKILGEY